MRSIKFPNMFRSNSTEVWKSSEYLKATKQNTFLILQTERGELECDPYFGLMLKHYLFSQNNYILKDMLIDTIYTQLALFLPQLKILRNSIEIIQDKECFCFQLCWLGFRLFFVQLVQLLNLF